MQSPFGVLSREGSIRWLQQLLGTDLAPLFRLLSLPGDIWGVLLAVALAMVCFGRRPAIGVAAASARAAPVRLALATLLAVPRPSGPGITVFDHQTIASFPSGHTFLAVVAWGTLAATTRVPAWVAAVAAVATAISRVYLGAHFPADVLAALLLGAVFIWAFLVGLGRLEQRLRGLGTGSWRAVAVVAMVGLLALAYGPLRPDELLDWELMGLAVGALLVLVTPSLPDAGEPPDCDVRLVGLTLVGVVAAALAARIAPGPAHPWLGAVLAAGAVLWIFAAVPRLVRRA